MTNRLGSAAPSPDAALHVLITTEENGAALKTKWYISFSLDAVRSRMARVVEPPLPAQVIMHISPDRAAYLRGELRKLTPDLSADDRLTAIEVAVHEAIYGCYDM